VTCHNGISHVLRAFFPPYARRTTKIEIAEYARTSFIELKNLYKRIPPKQCDVLRRVRTHLAEFIRVFICL